MNFVERCVDDYLLDSEVERLAASPEQYRHRLEQAGEGFDRLVRRWSTVHEGPLHEGYAEYRPIDLGHYDHQGTQKLTVIRPVLTLHRINHEGKPDKILRAFDVFWPDLPMTYLSSERLTKANSEQIGHVAIMSTRLENNRQNATDLCLFEGALDMAVQGIARAAKAAAAARR